MAAKEHSGRKKRALKAPSPQPWARPTPPAAGDADKETTFAAVGSALSSWEELEGQVARIFENLVSPHSESLPALRAYGSVVTFRGRAEMIKAAADATFFLMPDESLEKDLDGLLKEIGQFAGRRNELAHGIVRHHYRPSRLLITKPIMRHSPVGYVLGPPEYATNKTALEPGRTVLTPVHYAPSYAYSSVEILALQEHFKRLIGQVRDVSIRLYRHQEKQRKA